MQPTPPVNPNQPSYRSRSSFGSGAIVGVIALLAVVFLIDHLGKGEAAVFSGVERHISAQDFHGAQCTAIFGGCKIDLRDAKIQGSEAVLDTYAIFGGVEVWVPQDWEVVNHRVTIFGGTNDHRHRNPSASDAKTLILEGATVFGGLEIKD